MKKLTGIILIALMIFSIQAYSQPADGRGFGKFIKELKLTNEQKEDAKRIKVDLEKQLIAQKAKIETAHLELRQIFESDSPDKSSIEKKLNEIADLEVQKHMLRVDSWLAINTILTPEQQKIWKKALAEGWEMKHKMMNRNGHKPMMKNQDKKQMPENEGMDKPN